MPTYCYKCTECEALLEIRHPYKEKRLDCTVCGKPSLVKFLGTPIKYNIKKHNTEDKPGAVVGKTIHEIKQEVKKEKEKLKKRESK
jgi:putative FmdB family regulatory protein